MPLKARPRSTPAPSTTRPDNAATPLPPPPPQPIAEPRGIRRREPTPAIQTLEFTITGELASVVNQIKATYSPAVITRANREKVNYGRLASSILTLDLCLAGGLMLSRGAMIYGNRSAGKSTLAARFIASAQREFPTKVAVLIDVEGTFDVPWAVLNGVDQNRLLIVEPESGESAVDMADALIRAEETCIVVTDSIAFLTPMKELTSSAEDSLPGIHARLIGNYLRRSNNAMLQERHRGHFPINLYLNQFRMSIGTMFGDPRVLPGGKALEFATSQQIEVKNKEHMTGEDAGAAGGAKDSETKSKSVLFNEHNFIITKDKTGGRIKEGKFKLIRDERTGFPAGYIDQSASIRNIGLACGVLAGTPQSFSHSRYGQWRGAPAMAEYFVANPDVERSIVADIVDTYRAKWGVS